MEVDPEAPDTSDEAPKPPAAAEEPRASNTMIKMDIEDPKDHRALNTTIKMDIEDPKDQNRAMNPFSFIVMGPQSAFSVPPASENGLPTMPDRRRNFIAAQCGVAAMTASMNSSVIVPIVPVIQSTFSITTIETNLILTVSILMFALAPLAWAPFSDAFGRRNILMLSQLVATAGSIICLLSPTYGAFMAGRLIAMGGSGACISIGAGIISDVFPRDQRGRALGSLNLFMLIGPILSPPVAGAIAEHLGMRNVFTFAAIINAVVIGTVFGFMPETLEKKRRARMSRGRKAASGVETAQSADASAPKKAGPFTAFASLRYSFVSFVVLAPSVGYGSYYCLATNFARDLQHTYNLTVSETGYISVALFAGMMIGSMGGGTLADHMIITLRKLRGVFVPEDRLKAAWLGLLVCPIGPTLYGWIIQARWPWGVVIPAFLLTGFANFTVQTIATAYLVDIFATQAAAIISALNACRWLFGAMAPLISVPGYSLGPGWFFTIVGIVNVVAALLFLGVAFLNWFALRRLGTEPWAHGKDVDTQKEALIGADKASIPWPIVLLGGGHLRRLKDPEPGE